MKMSKINELFGKELKVINMGLESFANDLRDQNIETVQMNWKPPAGGNKKMMSLLSKLK
jgi:hypothetical protein